MHITVHKTPGFSLYNLKVNHFCVVQTYAWQQNSIMKNIIDKLTFQYNYQNLCCKAVFIFLNSFKLSVAFLNSVYRFKIAIQRKYKPKITFKE